MPDTSGCDCEDDQEEQLLRMFEDESVISSSEEEQIDKDECAIQAVQDDKKRQKEVDAWRLHIENGHAPFRRDCHHCILGSAINRQHRRVKHPTSYSLSVDLFGPLQTHERGRDEESVSGIPHLKYGLVGAFRIPKCVVEEPPIQVGSKDDGKYDDHLSDYEPSELEEWSQQPLEDHNTLGEVPRDLFEELLGEDEPPDCDVTAAAAEVPAQIPERSEIRLPWDDEVLPADDDLLLEYADELKTPVEQVVLRFMIGLKSKTGVDVAAGVQRLVLHINRDYPVRVLHCGPGTEFTSDRLKVWLSNQGVRLQHTLPTDKRSNGLAERTVGLLKARARTLLSSAALAAQYWPLAMRYACESHNRQVLGQPPLPIFGQRVLHRLKKPSGALNELMNRWVTTRYMTPHLSIPEGHMLINSEGNLVASKGFRANVVDPSAIEDLDFPALVVDDVTHLDEPEPPALSVVPPALAESPPKVRVRSKSRVRFLDAPSVPNDFNELAKTKLLDEDFTDLAFHELVESLRKQELATKDRRGDIEGRYILGAFCHGGKRGVSNIAKRYPSVVQFLNKFLRSRLPDAEKGVAAWSTILLARATDIPVHRDYRIEWGTRNFVTHVPGRMELWTAGCDHSKVTSEKVQPDWNSSEVRALDRSVVAFDARNYHAVRRVPDWFVVGYSPLGVRKILDHDKAMLRDLRFRLPTPQVQAVQVEAVRRSRSVNGPSSEEESSSSACEACSSSAGPSRLAGRTQDLMDDVQEDSITPIVGWDPTRDPANVPELNLEEMPLEAFLASRGVSGVSRQLEVMGIESPADLPFLYREDLVEFGVPELEARLIMKGIHPEGTLRPDNPNLCALRTGEVRLLDRRQRQLPWVIQNRTLDWRSPGPPVEGLGIKDPDGGHQPRLVDWELEEARRRGEFPNLFEQPDEELPSDPMDLPRPQVEDRSAGSSSAKDVCGSMLMQEQVNMYSSNRCGKMRSGICLPLSLEHQVL